MFNSLENFHGAILDLRPGQGSFKGIKGEPGFPQTIAKIWREETRFAPHFSNRGTGWQTSMVPDDLHSRPGGKTNSFPVTRETINEQTAILVITDPIQGAISPTDQIIFSGQCQGCLSLKAIAQAQRGNRY